MTIVEWWTTVDIEYQDHYITKTPDSVMPNSQAEWETAMTEEQNVANGGAGADRQDIAEQHTTMAKQQNVATTSTGVEKSEITEQLVAKTSKKRKAADNASTEQAPAKKRKSTAIKSIAESNSGLQESITTKPPAAQKSKKRKSATKVDPEDAPAEKQESVTTANGDAVNSGIEDAATNVIEQLPAKKSRKRKVAGDTASETLPAKKRKGAAADTEESTTADGEKAETATTTKPPAKKSRKRRTPSDSTAEDAPPKKIRKRAAPKTENGEASTPKPRKSRKKADTKKTTIPPPPPPLPPVPVSVGVATKITEVHHFINAHPELGLKHPRGQVVYAEPITTFPELDFVGIAHMLYWQYELGPPPENPFEELEDAIIKRFEKCDERIKQNINYVSVDATKLTKLEERIHEKIPRHGLEGKNLLMVEMDMMEKRNEEKIGGWRQGVQSLLSAFVDAVVDEQSATSASGQEATDGVGELTGDATASSLTLDGVSQGHWLGVCPAPMQEV